MSKDDPEVGELSPSELRAFAAGYLEAIRDRQTEWARLTRALEETERALAVEKRAAEIYYHDAYCGCRKRRTQSIIATTEVLTHRANRNGPERD